MLYDPKWNEPKPQPDIFALDTLIGWLEKQPANKIYIYTNPTYCLLAQYFTDITGKPSLVSRDDVIVGDSDKWTPLPSGWNQIATGNLLNWTFKAALKRAKRLRAKAAVGNTLSRIPQLLGLT